MAQGDPYFSRLSSSRLKSQLPPNGRCPCLPVGVGFGTQWGTGLQFGVGILRQVSHHRQFVHVGVDHLFGFHQLDSHFCQLRRNSLCWRMEFYLRDAQPVVGQIHGFGGVLQSILGVPVVPVGTQAWKERTWLMSVVVDISADDWL